MDTSKIIKGVVNSGRYTVTAPIVKEDYGLYLQIEGIELPPTYQVDFSNSEQNGTSVTMIGNSDGVLIPHQFIDTGKDIFAFLYHVGEDYGRTVYKFRIPNKVRPDRTEDTPTPEEQSVIDQAISALNEAVEQTSADVASADQLARSAQGYAEQAETAKSDAQTYANNASASATSASQSATASANSATASAQSASQSAQIKSDVEDLVDDARGYASASAQSASQASASEQGCARAVLDAASAAAIARARADEASGYAQTASAKAQDASGYAQTASQKATEASQSASQALSYKTDAESAKTASQTAQGLAESARDSAQGYAEDAQGYAEDAQASAESISASASQIAQNTSDIASLEEDRYKPYVTDSASGSIASFPDGADDIPLKSLVIDINPVQDLSHGDPSPENICPISGWTSVDVEQSGVNVWDEEWEVGDINATTGQNIASNTVVRTKNYIPVLPETDYFAYISGTSGLVLRARFYDSDKNYLGSNAYGGVSVAYNGVFKTPINCYFMRFTPQATYGTTYNHDISINYPSTDHYYHPYTGRSITINLGQTVYGGKLDVLSGVLTVDRAMVDLGSETFTKWVKDNNTFVCNVPGISTTNQNITCDTYAPLINGLTSWAAILRYDMTIYHPLNDIYLLIRDTRYTDATAFNTAMSGVQLVYPLATPIEIQLSANHINSLYGTNNLWADSGNTEAEYRADTKLFIERLTAPDSADMVADANITSGQYFMVGNSLYKATANIANGSAIIVGTNCTRKSLSEALNEINA